MKKCTYELELPLPEAAEVDEGLADSVGVTLLTTVTVSVPPPLVDVRTEVVGMRLELEVVVTEGAEVVGVGAEVVKEEDELEVVVEEVDVGLVLDEVEVEVKEGEDEVEVVVADVVGTVVVVGVVLVDDASVDVLAEVLHKGNSAETRFKRDRKTITRRL